MHHHYGKKIGDGRLLYLYLLVGSLKRPMRFESNIGMEFNGGGGLKVIFIMNHLGFWALMFANAPLI